MHFLRALLIGLALCLQGCALQLAPTYDTKIIETLTEATVLAGTEFELLKAGAPASSFPQHEKSYAELIGKLGAAQTLAKIRPAARSSSLFVPAPLRALAKGDPPSILAMENMAITITRMSSDHQTRGLDPTSVQGFENEFETLMDSALTYERALNR